MREQDVQELDVELQVGDTLRIGEYLITVVDTDSDEVTFRIDPFEEPNEVRIKDDIVTIH